VDYATNRNIDRLIRSFMKELIDKFKKRILQILFVPSLLWAIATIFVDEIETLFTLIPGEEEGWLHNVTENTLEIFLFAIFFAGVAYLFYRFRTFLVVPESVSLVWVLIRVVVYAVIIAVVLGVSIGFGWWTFIESGKDPNNMQYGMASYTMAFFWSAFLTPVCTVLLVWFSAKRRSANGMHT